MVDVNKVPTYKFFSSYPIVEYKKGERIMRPGETARYLFFVTHGYVRQYALSSAGQEFSMAIQSTGSLIYLPWTIGMTENPYTFETLTPVKVHKAPIEDFNNFVKKSPEIMYFIGSGSIIGMQILFTYMQSLVYGNATQKVAAVLTFITLLYGKPDDNKIRIDVPLTQKLLATFVGLTRETTSLALLELKDSGTIEYAKQYIKVLDMYKLQGFADNNVEHFYSFVLGLGNTTLREYLE